MVQCDALVAVGIAVSVHIFSWVYANLDCGRKASDDPPILQVLGWKVVK